MGSVSKKNASIMKTKSYNASKMIKKTKMGGYLENSKLWKEWRAKYSSLINSNPKAISPQIIKSFVEGMITIYHLGQYEFMPQEKDYEFLRKRMDNVISELNTNKDYVKAAQDIQTIILTTEDIYPVKKAHTFNLKQTKIAKIGTSDVEQILQHVKDIWVLMDNLQGIYKFVPERNLLRQFQTNMQKMLGYSER